MRPSIGLNEHGLTQLLTFLSFISLTFAQIITPAIPPEVVLSKAEATNCEQACAAIASSYPDSVFLDQTGNWDFWDAKQAELVPACRVEPSSSKDLSIILGQIIEKACHFAVKSGGHERTPGASNAEAGVTIDLVRLNNVEIARDRQSVTLGAGLRWGEVYHALEKEQLMVLGGRISDVGVGGYLLGGGISFFSNTRGLACDSIVSYELILPDTSIISVDKTSHPELYRALRGAGQMNFGIVTSFTVEAFPHTHKVWDGRKVFFWDDRKELLQANYEVTTNAMNDDAGIAVMNMVSCNAKRGFCLGIISAQHTTYNSSEDWPPSLKRYEEMEGISQTARTRIIPMTNVTEEFATASQPGKHRTIYGTLTYTPSVELELEMLKLLHKEIQSLSEINGFVPGVVMHPFSKTMIAKMHKNGSNAFRSNAAEEGPLTVMNIFWQWDQKSDDDQAYAAYYKLMDRFEEMAKEMKLWHPYKYINYAEATQDIWKGYSDVSDLKNLQKEMDPRGIFAKGGLAGGIHKLNDLSPTPKQSKTANIKHWNKDEL